VSIAQELPGLGSARRWAPLRVPAPSFAGPGHPEAPLRKVLARALRRGRLVFAQPRSALDSFGRGAPALRRESVSGRCAASTGAESERKRATGDCDCGAHGASRQWGVFERKWLAGAGSREHRSQQLERIPQRPEKLLRSS